jgi:thiol-disulfide isomerase/thioredoxin/NAD-dependent dihydropyrimidine dehydrogenase PreA subunit
MLGPLFTWKFLLMVSIVVGSIFIFRLFCRFICPLGGLYGLFNKFSLFGVKVDEAKCTHCNICVAHCKCDIKHVGDQECISCGECIDVCPTKAISWKGPKILLKANEIPADANDETKAKQEKTRLICRITTTVILLAVLIGTVIYFWDPTPAAPVTPPSQSETEDNGQDGKPAVGNKVGDLCPSVQLPLLTVSGVNEDETIDPTKTGKVTIINFWGTWCGPCKAELPDFDRIATDYADDVKIIAYHSDYAKNSALDYVQENFPDSNMIFATDEGDAYYTMLGGEGSYPMTWVLDENGVIIAQYVGMVHYDTLKGHIEAELQK